MRKAAVLFLATGFGLGYSPLVPGTVGSVPGVVLGFCMNALPGGPLPLWAQIGIIVALVVAAVPLCDAAESLLGRIDDRRIVADEYTTFPICMLGLPWTPWVVLMAFVTCRIMDIVKPPPARQLQGLAGGLGIVADDVMSSLYSLALNHAAYAVIVRYVIHRG